MAAGDENEYVDRFSGDQLLIPSLHAPMKPAFDGMMYEVQSKMVPLNSKNDGPQVIDLVDWYGLEHLDRINCLGMFDAYMDYYINALANVFEKREDEVLKDLEGVLEFLRSRFSDLKFYTGRRSFDFLVEGEPFPGGTLVVADTKASNPPTFYYFAHGLIGLFDDALERYLLSHSDGTSMPLYTSDEESESEEEKSEEEEEEDGDVDDLEEEEEIEEEEEEEMEQEKEEVTKEDWASKLKDLPLDDELFNPGPSRQHYLYHPSKGSSYWGGLVDKKQPVTAT